MSEEHKHWSQIRSGAFNPQLQSPFELQRHLQRLHPTKLTDLGFDATSPDLQAVSATVEFRYMNYDYEMARVSASGTVSFLIATGVVVLLIAVAWRLVK